jgi:hypothetical protein
MSENSPTRICIFKIFSGGYTPGPPLTRGRGGRGGERKGGEEKGGVGQEWEGRGWDNRGGREGMVEYGRGGRDRREGGRGIWTLTMLETD